MLPNAPIGVLVAALLLTNSHAHQSGGSSSSRHISSHSPSRLPSSTVKGSTTGTGTGTETETRTSTPLDTKVSTSRTGTESGTHTGPTTKASITSTGAGSDSDKTTSSSSSMPAYLFSSFVVAGVTVPPQTKIESGKFSTSTISSSVGPPGSHSVTTTTGSDHKATILPVWLSGDDDSSSGGGWPIIVFPESISGPPGIVPPPSGYDPLVITPEGTSEPDSYVDPDPDDDNTSKKTSATKDSSSATETDSKTTMSSTQHSSSSSSSSSSSFSVSSTSMSSTSSSTSPSSTSSSSTSSATGASTTRYIIMPSDSAKAADRETFENLLKKEISASEVWSSANDTNGTAFWVAPLNSTQMTTFANESIIDFIIEDIELEVDWAMTDDDANKTKSTRSVDDFDPHNDRTIDKRETLKTQRNVGDDMVVISQAPGTTLSNIPKNYVYNSIGGRGITVYMMDSGVSRTSFEYQDQKGTNKPVWMFGDMDPGADYKQNDQSPNRHGTCVFAKLGGPTYGVAKYIDIVVVKITSGNDDLHPQIQLSSFLNGIILVKNDILSENLQGKAVFTTSIGLIYNNKLSDSDWDRVEGKTVRLLRGISALDVSIISASGNHGSDGSEVDTLPSNMAARAPGMMPIGSVNSAGIVSSFSQEGPLVNLHAVGEEVACGGGKITSGTSIAAPQVAGIVAYFMSLGTHDFGTIGSGTIPGNIKTFMETDGSGSYPRADNGVLVLWNQQRNGECSTSGSTKRDDSTNGTCSLASSGSVSSSQSATILTTTTHSTSSSSSSSSSSSISFTSSSTSSSISSSISSTTTTSTQSTTLSCAPTGGVSLPQPTIQSNLNTFCDILKNDYNDYISCNGETYRGFLLSSSGYCAGNNQASYALQYFKGTSTLWFNVTLTTGDYYVLESTQCSTALNDILNDCAPFSAATLDDLEKVGGSLTWKNGTTGSAKFSITIEPE